MLTFEKFKKNLSLTKKIKAEYDMLQAKYDRIKKECYKQYRKHNNYIETSSNGFWIIEEKIDSIWRKHCYECEYLGEGNCHGCVVYDIISELENASAAREI